MATPSLAPGRMWFVRTIENCPYAGNCRYANICTWEGETERFHYGKAVRQVTTAFLSRLLGLFCLLLGLAMSVTLFLAPVGVVIAVVGIALLLSAKEAPLVRGP